jgi:hypothetical protein
LEISGAWCGRIETEAVAFTKAGAAHPSGGQSRVRLRQSGQDEKQVKSDRNDGGRQAPMFG